ncbi:MAG: DinB family protein [Acidimicrobiia bacterium]|nr:DinB family protein [Acidimicrobiia bacterium]
MAERALASDDVRAAWQALEQAWASTIERARRLTEEQLHESVGGEWSFVDTLRHLVFAMDKWFTTLILGDEEFQHIRYAVRDLAHLE